jgi:hypothetical protein
MNWQDILKQDKKYRRVEFVNRIGDSQDNPSYLDEYDLRFGIGGSSYFRDLHKYVKENKKETGLDKIIVKPITDSKGEKIILVYLYYNSSIEVDTGRKTTDGQRVYRTVSDDYSIPSISHKYIVNPSDSEYKAIRKKIEDNEREAAKVGEKK